MAFVNIAPFVHHFNQTPLSPGPEKKPRRSLRKALMTDLPTWLYYKLNLHR